MPLAIGNCNEHHGRPLISIRTAWPLPCCFELYHRNALETYPGDQGAAEFEKFVGYGNRLAGAASGSAWVHFPNPQPLEGQVESLIHGQGSETDTRARDEFLHQHIACFAESLLHFLSEIVLRIGVGHRSKHGPLSQPSRRKPVLEYHRKSEFPAPCRSANDCTRAVSGTGTFTLTSE